MNAINDRQVARNVAIHDRIARRYETIHGEIFNDVEQDRLCAALGKGRDLIRTNRETLKALDFGCGSGNLTRHLISLGVDVTSADVSRGFLDLVASRYPQVTTHLMERGSTRGLLNESFDLVATYSVLHHIPDYLGAVTELCRVCRPGGVIIIDHEPSDEFWLGKPVYKTFRRAALRFDWRKYATPSNYAHAARRIFNPRHANEGDIHVWPDDHIEWSKIKSLMAHNNFEIVYEESYLLYRELYRRKVYDRFVGQCTDTTVMMFRKIC